MTDLENPENPNLHKVISEGIWRQKCQEAALKLFMSFIVVPAILIAIVLYNAPKCQHKALFCPDAPTTTARGAPK